MTATVTGIDAASRKVTLVTPEGKKTTVKCGPEVINFDQIRVGDQLKVTVTERSRCIWPGGSPPSEAQPRQWHWLPGRQAGRRRGQHGAGHRQGQSD